MPEYHIYLEILLRSPIELDWISSYSSSDLWSYMYLPHFLDPIRSIPGSWIYELLKICKIGSAILWFRNPPWWIFDLIIVWNERIEIFEQLSPQHSTSIYTLFTMDLDWIESCSRPVINCALNSAIRIHVCRFECKYWSTAAGTTQMQL